LKNIRISNFIQYNSNTNYNGFSLQSILKIKNKKDKAGILGVFVMLQSVLFVKKIDLKF